ncbi:hypothetical protein C8R45DRAFT_936624 [Mycena sanguinolenta]|nr:hypothetical protein C8R45DRAFT_936624 [Mycena sanguinolenta]
MILRDVWRPVHLVPMQDIRGGCMQCWWVSTPRLEQREREQRLVRSQQKGLRGCPSWRTSGRAGVQSGRKDYGLHDERRAVPRLRAAFARGEDRRNGGMREHVRNKQGNGRRDRPSDTGRVRRLASAATWGAELDKRSLRAMHPSSDQRKRRAEVGRAAAAVERESGDTVDVSLRHRRAQRLVAAGKPQTERSRCRGSVEGTARRRGTGCRTATREALSVMLSEFWLCGVTQVAVDSGAAELRAYGHSRVRRRSVSEREWREEGKVAKRRQKDIMKERAWQSGRSTPERNVMAVARLIGSPGLPGMAGLAFLKPEPWARQSPVPGSARLVQARARLGSACGPRPSPEHHYARPVLGITTGWRMPAR